MPEIILQGTSQIQVAVLAGPTIPVSVSPGIGASVVVNGTATSIFGTAGINPFVAGDNITITTTGGGITIIGRTPPVASVQGKTGSVILSASDVNAAPAFHTHSTSDISLFTTAASLASPVQSVAGRTGAVVLTTTDVSSFTTSARAVAPVQSVAGRTGAVVLTTTDVASFTTSARAVAPVQSVAGRTGAVVLTTTDVSGLSATIGSAVKVLSVQGQTGDVTLTYVSSLNSATGAVTLVGGQGVNISVSGNSVEIAAESNPEAVAATLWPAFILGG